MKFKIKSNGTWWNDEISEKNSKFKCENCGKEIYGKKGKYDDGYIRILCLKCFVKHYESLFLQDDTEVKETVGKALKEIKEKYELDLVALEL